MKTNLKNIVVTVMFASLIITGCASTKAEDVKQEVTTTVQAENVEVENETEVQEVESETTVVETEVSTESLEVESVTYEGVDMNSTLPGAEWIDTFVLEINVPKLVIYNDETNKKVIVEDGQEVEFQKNDILAIYSPGGNFGIKTVDRNAFLKMEVYDMFYTLSEVSDAWWEYGTNTPVNVVECNGEEYTLTCTLLFKE